MKIWNGCRKAVYGILFALILPMSAYIFYGAVDTLKYADGLSLWIQGKAVPIFLTGTALLLGMLLLGLFWRWSTVLEKKFARSAVLLVGMMVLLQVLTVLFLRTSFRQDHLKIFDTAAALLEYDTIAETHFRTYFMKYPNNIPMCLFTYGWLKLLAFAGVPKSIWIDVMKLINILFMNVGMLAVFRLLCRHRNRRNGLFFLLFLLVNPLWYLLSEMYYTSTISLAFSMAAIWLFDLAGREKRTVIRLAEYACTGVLLAAGYKIRATVILTAVSLVIYAVLALDETKLRQWKERAVSWGTAVLAVFVGMVLVWSAYGAAERHYAGFDPGETGYPMVHWIMMSAQGDGQYNSADDAYTGSFATKEERTAADAAEWKRRVTEMGPDGVLTLFRNKLRVAFSDGTDDYYGLFRTMQEPSSVQRYINGGRSDYLAWYLHSYHGLLTALVTAALAFRAFRGKESAWDILVINLCGAYLFYLIWEVDQAYSIPFLLILTALAAEGAERIEEDLEQPKKLLAFAGKWIPAGAACVLAVEAAGVWILVQKADLPVKEYCVLQDQESSEMLTLQTDFSQTFRTGKTFDHLDLWVANWDGAANDSVYQVVIQDKAGKTVAEGKVIGAQAPCMSAYTISFAAVEPEREQNYTIQVSLENPDCQIRTDFLYYQANWDLYPDGALYAPEEERAVDLAFSVYQVL